MTAVTAWVKETPTLDGYYVLSPDEGFQRITAEDVPRYVSESGVSVFHIHHDPDEALPTMLLIESENT